jgi:hypothetical protein
MTEYQIGPSRLGLIIKAGSGFVDSYVRDVFNGFPVENAPDGHNTNLVLEIEEGGNERAPDPRSKEPSQGVDGIEYSYDGERAVFETSALTGEIYFAGGEGWINVIDVQSVDLEAVLRHVVFYLAARAGFATLHSVSWVLDGRAYVSCGPPESGKSTIGRMLKGSLPVLSDEFNLVDGPNEPRVWRAPVREAVPLESPDENYPLAAVTFHIKNDRPYIRRMYPAEALRETEKNVFGDPFTNEDTKSDIFCFLSDLSLSTSFFEIGVTLNKNDILKTIKEIGGH